MIIYNPGDIVLVDFIQFNTSLRKKRPALVILDTGDNDVVLAPITTRERNGVGDYKLKNWKNCGLLKDSWLRLSKVSCLQKNDISCKLGEITDIDMDNICNIWQELYLLK
ncbi:MAG: type II toxin-antitoxin system PemK/MazF family toxin [Candidatus Eremiobacterota bacterium]